METIVLCLCLLLSAYCLLPTAFSEPHMFFRRPFHALVALFG
ncbi:MAG: hypothetical protein QOF72_1190 [Blastocatellia bacterium]|nr:hypothetical protein [Blastocatellia bacterium]